MHSQTILIVDDEPDIREILCFNLEQAGYRCLQAANGQQALELLEREKADLVLLDVMMPGMSGFEVAKHITDIPVIFLTALGEEDDMLRGFSLGADDYITKPFSLKLLLARVEAVLKRTQSVQPLPLVSDSERFGMEKRPEWSFRRDGVLCIAEGERGLLLLNDSTFSASIDGCDLGLSKMEYELLHFLLQHPGVVYARSELLTQVWPNNGLVLDRTVDVTITRLRKKIGDYKKHIKTKTGYGYYWEK